MRFDSAASVHRRRARRDLRRHRHDRRDVLPNWVAPEPLVAGAMVVVGFGDLPDRDLRRGLGLPHRRRRRRSRRADTLGPTARLRLCATMPAMAIKEPSFTIGIEEEYLLVDRTTRDLAQEPPPALLAKCEEALRSEEHTSELQSLRHLVCRLLLEKK